MDESKVTPSQAIPIRRRPGTKTLAEYFPEIRRLCIEKGWRENTDTRERHVFAAYLALLHSEISEALEAYRIRDWSSTREDGKPMGVGPELADVFIRLIDMCDLFGIDLASEIERVMAHNWTRSYQHGGKTL